MADPNTDAITLAVIASKIDDVREDVHGLKADIADVKKETVGRGEWVQRNNHVDERFKHTAETFAAQGREIAQLRTDNQTANAALKAEVDSRRAPWWSVASVLAAVGALLYSIFGPNI